MVPMTLPVCLMKVNDTVNLSLTERKVCQDEMLVRTDSTSNLRINSG